MQIITIHGLHEDVRHISSGMISFKMGEGKLHGLQNPFMRVAIKRGNVVTSNR